MRGYFAVGVEAINKPMNLGSLWRTAHAFGAAFIFTVAAAYVRREGTRADTSDAEGQVPLYSFTDVDALLLPRGCRLVGVELIPDAIELPSFHHPRCAAYVFGPERGSLSPAMLGRCDSVVRIPTRFAVNLAIAGAIVMYDRVASLGRFAPRPEWSGGEAVALPEPVFGPPRLRRRGGD